MLTRHLLPYMKSQSHKSCIVIVSSGGVHYPVMPYLTTYIATKAYNLSFGQCLAEELKGSNVEVHVTCPGHVMTYEGKVGGFTISTEMNAKAMLGCLGYGEVYNYGHWRH